MAESGNNEGGMAIPQWESGKDLVRCLVCYREGITRIYRNKTGSIYRQDRVTGAA